MKRSIGVTIGMVLVAGMTVACSAEQDQEFMEADHQEICVRPLEGGEMERRPDHECSDTGSSTVGTCAICWFYLGKAFGTPPAHGARFNPSGHGSFTKPSTGTFARPPASGGFGTTKVSVGG